jgi:hypothetical protein
MPADPTNIQRSELRLGSAKIGRSLFAEGGETLSEIAGPAGDGLHLSLVAQRFVDAARYEGVVRKLTLRKSERSRPASQLGG